MSFGISMATTAGIAYGAYKGARKYMDWKNKNPGDKSRAAASAKVKAAARLRRKQLYRDVKWVTPVPRSASVRRMKPTYSRQSYKYKFKKYS